MHGHELEDWFRAKEEITIKKFPSRHRLILCTHSQPEREAGTVDNTQGSPATCRSVRDLLYFLAALENRCAHSVISATNTSVSDSLRTRLVFEGAPGSIPQLLQPRGHLQRMHSFKLFRIPLI
jgi:hypothetical protein